MLMAVSLSVLGGVVLIVRVLRRKAGLAKGVSKV